MKRNLIISISAVLFMSLSAGCSNKSSNVVNKSGNAPKYKDGIYEAQVPADYEGYSCKGKITIKNGEIIKVDWNIYDSNNRVFDDKYEKVFNDEQYKQQCRDDYKGEKTYGPKLIETQDITKVDAVSGATWTNNFFKEVMGEALNKAKI